MEFNIIFDDNFPPSFYFIFLFFWSCKSVVNFFYRYFFDISYFVLSDPFISFTLANFVLSVLLVCVLCVCVLYKSMNLVHFGVLLRP